MEPFLEFILEHTSRNSIPILLAASAASAASYFIGPFLVSLGANKYFRSIIYTLVGVSAGMWTYITYDVVGGGVEGLEAYTLSTGMFILTFFVVFPVVAIKSRKVKN